MRTNLIVSVIWNDLHCCAGMNVLNVTSILHFLEQNIQIFICLKYIFINAIASHAILLSCHLLCCHFLYLEWSYYFPISLIPNETLDFISRTYIYSLHWYLVHNFVVVNNWSVKKIVCQNLFNRFSSQKSKMR